MTEKAFIRVTMDGSIPKYELIVDQTKIADMAWSEVLELALQATSALRWLPRK